MLKRRAAIALLGQASVSLLAGCVAAPVAAPTSAPMPASTPVSATNAPTAISPPTSAPTATPLPPTPVPTLAPTAAPSVRATPTPPSALADGVAGAMRAAIDRGATPGGVVLILHNETELLLEAYGLSRKYASRDELADQAVAATTDTLYDLASITKLFTTTCVMRLVEQARLGMDEPVARWLPQFAAGGKQTVTLRQILTHTSGLPDYLKLWELEPTPETRVQRVLETPLLHRPGSVYLYSDLGLIAVGRLLEVITGSSLDALVQDTVLGPLGLSQTMYRPSAALRARTAATEDESDIGRGMVWGEVDDANAWALGGVAGHAGLFATARDLGRFAQAFLKDELLEKETIAEMTRNQIGTLGWRGLGWELNARYYMGTLAAPSTFGHTGFTGTSLVIDPVRELIVVLLTNRVHATPHGPSINGLRQAVANAAAATAT